jgi:OOP family OmpA-OmpF porin
MKKRLALLCACSALPLALSRTTLADEVGNWYVTPSFGAIFMGNDRPTEDKDWLYGLAIGKHLSPGWSLELNVNGDKVGGRTALDPDLTNYAQSLDLLKVFGRGQVFEPYISVGTGVLENEPRPGRNSEDWMYQAGIGAFIRLWENSSGSTVLSLRPDMKARWDDAGAPGTYTDYLATLGFQIAFGAKKSAPPLAEPLPAPARAAPAPVPAAEPAPPPPPPPPGDADKDGVTDDMDQCPNTPLGVAVDAKGCPLKASIVLEGVTFDVNSARLTIQSQPILDEVAAGLKKHPRLKVELQGHTDDTGPDAYNLSLSRKRADSVREYLLTQGVPGTQLTAKGYGETQPLESNKTPEGRAKNRRVVMYVIENPGDVKIEGEGKVQ